jgi:hypothetical protein
VVPITVVLTAFNSQGGQVARATLDLNSQGKRPIQTPIEAVSQAQDITRASISTLFEGQPGGTSGIAIDDIEFDTAGPPPVCPATDKAFVGIQQPRTGLRTQIGSFLLQGLVVSDAPLEEATLTLVRPDGTSATGDLLSAGLVQLDDGPFGPVRCSPLIPGVNKVRVRVKNCFGGETEESSVTYSPVQPGTKFILKGIQFMQAVQGLSNLVPLIAGKRTVARVYLQLTPPTSGTINSIFDVTATMTATDSGGTPLGGPLKINSLNSVTVTSNPDPSEQFNLAKTLNFELPPEWIVEGTIHTHLERFSIEGEQTLLDCVGCNTPFQFGVARFEAAPPLRVVLFEFPWTTDGGVTTHNPAATHFDHLESWLRRAYPTDDVRVTRQGAIAAFDGHPDVDFDCDDVNARLFQQIAMCNCDPQTHFYGMVDDGVLMADFMRGCSRGIPARVASGPAGTDTWGWDSDGSYADWYGGHELGHTYNRRHPGYCNDQEEDDEDYPYSGGKIGAVQSGFDVGDSTLSIPMAVLSPAIFTDVMTYCDFEWISDYTYLGILARLRTIEASPGGGSVGGSGGAVGEALMVQGKIDLVLNQVTLRPFLRLEGLLLTRLPDSSPFAMELRDPAGTALARYPFEVDVESEPEPNRNLMASFDVVVPWEDGTRTIVILKDGQTLASRTVSRNPPQVHLDTVGLLPGGKILRVNWSGDDADGDRLTFALQYTNDGGRSWIPIDTGLTVTQLDVPVLRLPGGAQCAFRIIATDGANTAIDVQDSPMAIPNRSPRAKILSPQSGLRIRSDQPLLLRGEGSDLEDGHLSGDDLTWSSEAARVLGKGATLSVNDLGPGSHTIALSARDSDVATGSDSIQVEVLPVEVAALAEVDSPVQVGSSVFLDGSFSTGQGLLSYKWSLLAKPEGSAAVVNLSEQAVAKLTVDRPGT